VTDPDALRVLMICYYYPPITDVGSKRSVAFSKYFKKHGWAPIVLSVRNPDRNYCLVGATAPPEGVRTLYVRSIANLSWALGKLNGALSRLLGLFRIELKGNVFHDALCFPDRFVGWVPGAVAAGLRMLRGSRIDLIYVSCSPFSSALAGVILKKCAGRPLILDFRDPFVTGVATHFTASALRRKLLSRFERWFVENADLLVVTSGETRGAYVEAYPEHADKIATIYNGFDPVTPLSSELGKFDKFTVIYTGQFYRFGPDHEIHTRHFFQALAHLQAAGDISPDTFQFLFFGDEHRFISDTARAYGVSDLVVSRGRVAYDEVLLSVRRSHLMLLRIVKLMISTKLFEGIALNVPFLATIPHGEAEELIRRYSPGSYIVTDEDSHLDVAEAIRDAVRKYGCGRVPTNHVGPFLTEFSREQQAKQVMRLVDVRFPELRSAR